MPELPEFVWLTRHAETATPNMFHGAESDIGLSELGMKQAEAAATWCREFKLTRVISSGMRRAIATAAPIALACGVDHQIHADLHERRVGVLCGQEFQMVQGPWATTIERWQAGDTAYTTEGAESYQEISTRVLQAWQTIISTYPGERILIVAHGIVCKVLLLNLLPGWDSTGWQQLGRVANLSITQLRHDGQAWQAQSLLQIPEPVSALSAGESTGLGVIPKRSEA